MTAITVLLALAMLGAGLAIGWALARAKIVGDGAGVLAERDAARAETAQLRAERDAVAAEVRAAEARVASTEATLAAERRAAADKIVLLERAQAQLKDTFDSLAKDALRHNNAQFLDLADTRLKQAGAPLTETLTKVEQQMREIEKERAGAQRALADQIERVRLSGDELKRETAALVSALRKPQARGRWGELQLRRCIEFAGMTDRCDFTEQASVQTADGLLRPDLVVRLVGGKSIVVDSKVTLAAYLEAHDAVDDAVREERLAAHARHLRTHVDQLAAKAYWSQFSPAPEFVVLFVPGDAFLAAALDRDGDLLDYAFNKRIHIATPTTLISVLRTCAYAWQQDALAANAREVFDLGRELYLRIGKLGAKVETLGKRLGSTVGAYNEAVASLESRVLPQARKLRDLKVVDDDLVEPQPVEEAVRPIAAAELVAAAEESRAVVALPAAALLGDELDRPEDYGLGTTAPDAQRKTSAG
ncbi:MAG: recombination protein RmuC [Frankiaceae bacterium]|nr:recombination protein RmuC [Frankiaceae bacterium]